MFGALPKSIILDGTITLAEKGVLIALAAHADKAGDCHPSQATIAKGLGICRKTVNRSINSLARKELITITPRFRDDGSKTTALYHLNFDRFDGLSHGRDTGSHGSGDVSYGVGRDVPRGEARSPNMNSTKNKTKEQIEVADAPKTAPKAKRKQKPTLAQKPPTLDEVTPYAVELGFTNTALVEWFEYWTSVGWRSKRTSYRDWKAMLRTRKAQLQGWGKWEQRRAATPQTGSPPPQRAKKHAWTCSLEEWLEQELPPDADDWQRQQKTDEWTNMNGGEV